jgi:hypothetical protein
MREGIQMPRIKTPTQLICREVYQEALEWREQKDPSPEMLKQGICMLLRRRLDAASISYTPSMIDSLMGGVIAMFRKAEKDAGGRFSYQAPTLTKTIGVSLSGFIRPIEILESPSILRDVDLDAIAAARVRLQTAEETPFEGDSNEIDFLSGLSGSPTGESASEETESISLSSPTKENAA